jgi:kynurenine formamidase
MKSDNLAQLLSSAGDCDVVQLGHELRVGMPRFESHPPFMYSLTAQHGGSAMPGQFAGSSGASDAFAMGVHTGTHMDSLSHIAFHECLCDGTNVMAAGVQSAAAGVRMQSGDAIRPVVRPGVLLDFPRHLGVTLLPREMAITPRDVADCARAQGTPIRRGDVVLFRTGWDTLYDDHRAYTRMPMPGPDADTARYLAETGVVAAGSDTLAFEQAPGPRPLEVHVELISKAGIFILESMDLRELSRRQANSFLFVVLPLRMSGATGSPVNPIALVARPAA